MLAPLKVVQVKMVFGKSRLAVVLRSLCPNEVSLEELLKLHLEI